MIQEPRVNLAGGMYFFDAHAHAQSLADYQNAGGGWDGQRLMQRFSVITNLEEGIKAVEAGFQRA